MRPIEDWYLPQDGDDISHAWRRCMEGGDGLDPIRTDSSELGGTVLFGAKTYWARSVISVRQIRDHTMTTTPPPSGTFWVRRA